MAILILLLGALFLVFFMIIAIIIGAGIIEGRKRPERQGRPDDSAGRA